MIDINLLFAHPENPNVMSKKNLQKLTRHIEESGNYEPVIIRKHPQMAGKFQIINGHHRVAALRSLRFTQVACVQWDVDDKQTLVLVQSLNRLCGKDDPDKKMAVIQKLSQNYDSKTLSKILPDTRQTIERLINSTAANFDQKKIAKAYLNSLVFFVDDKQFETVTSALEAACENINITGKAAVQTNNTFNAIALTQICDQFLNDKHNKEQQ